MALGLPNILRILYYRARQEALTRIVELIGMVELPEADS